MGTAFKHGHFVELPVLHGQFAVVGREYDDGVVEQMGFPQS